MAWTAPTTWIDGTAVDAAALNLHIRDNFRYLKGQDGPIALENAIELLEQATPATPGTGRGRLFVGNSGARNGVASCVDDAGNLYQMVQFASDAWTPTIIGSGGGGVFTYTLRTGRYIRIGPLVLASWVVTLATFSSAPAGNLQMTGLPFTVRNAFPNGGGSITYTNGGLSGISRIVAEQNTTRLDFYANSGLAIAASVLDINLNFQGIAIYEAAP